VKAWFQIVCYFDKSVSNMGWRDTPMTW
jgi:hypothetical protein